MKKKILSLLLTLALVLAALPLAVYAGSADSSFEKLYRESAQQLIKAAAEPVPGSIGGDWAVIGLARSGEELPKDYLERYYERIEALVKEKQGILHTVKYTEYSRTVLALTAMGKDPCNVAGFDLLLPLGDFEKTCRQGLNGAIWALLALDSVAYEVPSNSQARVQASRELYVQEILSRELAEGGWNLTGSGAADADITAMALQALASYRSQPEVSAAIERGLSLLSEMQLPSGGFSSWGTENAESLAQVIVALCRLDMDPQTPEFVKNGHTLVYALLTYRRNDGSFCHVKDGSNGSNQMAFEQCFYALTAVKRRAEGKTDLYDMTDLVLRPSEGPAALIPAEGVRSLPVTKKGITFTDLESDPCKIAVEALAAREIIDGMGDGSFRPQRTMTRAQFCTIMVKALGLSPEESDTFTDVPAGLWYSGYVGTANRRGIVEGVGNGRFNPNGTITRQEAAVMTARAAALCGMDTAMEEGQIMDTLCLFDDYVQAAGWAKESLAFCFARDICDSSAMTIEPKKAILRGEIARMVYNLLEKASLLSE